MYMLPWSMLPWSQTHSPNSPEAPRTLQWLFDHLNGLVRKQQRESQSAGQPALLWGPSLQRTCRPRTRCGAFRWTSSALAGRPPLGWPIPSHTPSPWYLVSGYRKSHNYSTEAAGSSVPAPVTTAYFLSAAKLPASSLPLGGDVFTPSLERSLENNPGNLKGDRHFHTPSG